MSKKPLIALLLAAAAAGAVWGLARLNGKAPDPDAAFVLYGNVDIRQVQLGFRVGGRLVAAQVDEGDAVAPEMLLARLDPVPFADALRAAEAQRDMAEAALLKAVNGPRPAEIDQARATVRELQANLKLADQTFDRQRHLFKTGASTEANLDEATAARDAAKNKLQASRDALALLEEGTRAEDIAAARADLRAAEAAVAGAKTSLADTELNAPSKGVVISRVREPGAIVAAGETVFAVSLDEPVWVRAYVAETRLGRVHPGLEVEVTNDSRPDKPYKGVVGFVSPVAEFTPKSVETPELRTDLVYRIRVVIAHPGSGLRQGMPVTVHVPAQKHE